MQGCINTNYISYFHLVLTKYLSKKVNMEGYSFWLKVYEDTIKSSF